MKVIRHRCGCHSCAETGDPIRLTDEELVPIELIVADDPGASDPFSSNLSHPESQLRLFEGEGDLLEEELCSMCGGTAEPPHHEACCPAVACIGDDS